MDKIGLKIIQTSIFRPLTPQKAQQYTRRFILPVDVRWVERGDITDWV